MSPRTRRLLGPHGKNNYIIAVKWIFKRSKIANLTPNELAKLKKFKADNKGRYIEEDAFYRLLRYAPSNTYELAYLLVFKTGIRPHELLSVTVQDVEERSDGLVLMKIPEENHITPSKKNKTGGRTIIVQQNATQLLKRVKRLKITQPQASHMRLFPLKNGMFSIIFSRMKQKQLKEASNPETPFKGRLYDLRHTAITNLYLKGLSNQEVRKLVGWTPSSKMPDVYVHLHINHIITSFRRKSTLRARTIP
ncbi:MAG: tyrosine-type recombinase/integrase [Promethearchaeota archaeon]